MKIARLALFSTFCALSSGVWAVGAFAAPEPLEVAGVAPDFKTLKIESPNVYDYTFSTAPTDWRIASGVWEMTNRWSCSPGWSWFGGRSDEVAAIWNKRRLAGDQSAQVYFAFKMGMSDVASWPEYPADAAVTICGDGQSLGTGYAFIAGAYDNSCSVLLRNGVEVARSSAPEAILPRLTDGKPGNEAMHRRWWYSRLEKVGATVTAYLDDKPILSFRDPQPLEGGQAAIWTLNNGLMIARVQLYFEREMSARPVAVPVALPVSAPVQKSAPVKPSKARPQLASARKLTRVR